MEMYKYPVIHIYPTIQGHGPEIGTQMVIVRTSSPPQTRFIYHKTIRETLYKMMSPYEILEKIKPFNIKTVFIGGDDPCITPLEPLLYMLKQEGYITQIDTCGAFWVEPGLVDYLSIGPKPGISFIPQLINHAADLRFYWEPNAAPVWEANIHRVIPYANSVRQICVAPRNLAKETIEALTKFIAGYPDPRFRADIPLFRLLPNFDAHMNKGQDCPICHLMDVWESQPYKEGDYDFLI